MHSSKKVKALMIPLVDYPHIPYWFSLRQAMAVVRETARRSKGTPVPLTLLVFDEKYQLMGMVTLRDIVRGLEPRFLRETDGIKMDPSLTVLMEDLLGPQMKEASQRPVSEVMSPIKATVNSDDPIAKALYLMIQQDMRRIPVVQDNKVVGIIRLTDLFHEILDVVLAE